MRILIYTHEFLPYKGGAAFYSRDLLSGLLAAGHDVRVCAPEYSSNTGQAESGIPATVRFSKSRLHEPWYLNPVVDFIHEFRPDLVLATERVAHEVLAAIPVRWFQYGAVIHGSEVWRYLDPHRGSLDQSMRKRMHDYFSGASVLITGSNATRELLLKHLPDVRSKTYTVHYGIDVGRLTPVQEGDVSDMRHRLGAVDSHVILCVGRLGADKGQDTLLRGFKQVLEAVPNTILVVAGEGAYQKTLLEMAEELGVMERVRFVGSVDDEELPVYYKLCDVFALLSRCETRWEGFGLVFLEAGYYRKPVIGGAAGGVPEAIVDGVTGILVNPYESQEFAAAAIRMLHSPELRCRMGAAGRRRVVDDFTAERMARETALHLEMNVYDLNIWEQTISKMRSYCNWFIGRSRRGVRSMRYRVGSVRRRLCTSIAK